MVSNLSTGVVLYRRALALDNDGDGPAADHLLPGPGHRPAAAVPAARAAGEHRSAAVDQAARRARVAAELCEAAGRDARYVNTVLPRRDFVRWDDRAGGRASRAAAADLPALVVHVATRNS